MTVGRSTTPAGAYGSPEWTRRARPTSTRPISAWATARSSPPCARIRVRGRGVHHPRGRMGPRRDQGRPRRRRGRGARNGDSPSAAILHMRVTDSYAEGALLENEDPSGPVPQRRGRWPRGPRLRSRRAGAGGRGPALPDTGDAAAAALPWLAAACGVGAAAGRRLGALRLRRERKGKADAGQGPEGAEEPRAGLGGRGAPALRAARP